MALVLKDRVRETSTTTGTGTFTLAGAVAGFQSFSAVGTGNQTYYTIATTSDWEVGIGTWTSPDQLSRDTVLASTNAGALVTFGSGTKDVFVTLPSERAIYTETAGNRLQINNPVALSNVGTGIIECVDDGLFDGYNDLRIYATDGVTDYAPFFNAGIASANFVIRSQDWTTNYQYVTLQVPSGMSAVYTLTLPTTAGSANQVLKTDGSGNTSWTDKFVLGAGTATAGTAPLKFTSGTNLTTAEAGAMEYDGKVPYFSGAASQRGVILATQFITQTANYTTPVGTANTLKQLFNSTTNGALTVAANTTYLFECMINISSMSATAGTLQFGLNGTATYSSVLYTAIANKTALTVQTASSHTMGTVATAVVITASNTTTTGYAFIKGKIVIGTGGTIVPSFALSIAAAAVVNTGSYFVLTPIGSNTVTNVGNWS